MLNDKIYSKAKRTGYRESTFNYCPYVDPRVMERYHVSSSGAESVTAQQAAAAEPVEAVPVQVVTQAPARSKWLYIAIGAAVAWLIFGRL